MGDLYAAAGFDEATSHSGLRWFITKLARSDISARVNILRQNGIDHVTEFWDLLDRSGRSLYKMWCATRARNTSGGRTHLDTCWLGPVANGQFDRVTGWTEAP